MSRPAARIVRRRFFMALGHAIHLAWPVLSVIFAVQVALGLLIGLLEGWSVGDALYSCRDRRSRGHLRSGLAFAGSSSRAS